MRANHQASESLCLWCLEPVFNDQHLLEWFLPTPLCCGRCRLHLQNKPIQLRLKGVNITACVWYDEQIQQLLYRFKEDGDILLAPLFFHYQKRWLKKHFKDTTFIPMPSSKEKISSRGFNHLRLMSKQCSLNLVDGLIKTRNIKQSTQSKAKRAQIKEVLQLDPSFIMPAGKVCLLDDVCTTGSTLLSAASLLSIDDKPMEAFVFALSPLFKDKVLKKRVKILGNTK